MTWRKRILLALTALFSSKAAWSTTAAGAAAVTAHQLGRDPVPWLIGAAAVTVVYAHFRQGDKFKDLANGVISIFLAGVGAPFLGAQLVERELVSPGPINEWMLAGILGGGWPWLVPLIRDLIGSVVDALKARLQGGARGN